MVIILLSYIVFINVVHCPLCSRCQIILAQKPTVLHGPRYVQYSTFHYIVAKLRELNWNTSFINVVHQNTQTRIPLPLPPETALIRTGYPTSLATFKAWSKLDNSCVCKKTLTAKRNRFIKSQKLCLAMKIQNQVNCILFPVKRWSGATGLRIKHHSIYNLLLTGSGIGCVRKRTMLCWCQLRQNFSLLYSALLIMQQTAITMATST